MFFGGYIATLNQRRLPKKTDWNQNLFSPFQRVFNQQPDLKPKPFFKTTERNVFLLVTWKRGLPQTWNRSKLNRRGLVAREPWRSLLRSRHQHADEDMQSSEGKWSRLWEQMCWGLKKEEFFFPNGVTASNLAVWPLQIYLCKRYLEGNSARVFSTFHLTLSRSIAWISMVFAPTLSHSISLYLRLSHQISTLSLLYLYSISGLSPSYLTAISWLSLVYPSGLSCFQASFSRSFNALTIRVLA